MAKKTNLQQPSIFKKEIPQMPEGYYSSGPNPNLAKFVEENTTPYDLETDYYNVPPFDKKIDISNRRNPINDLHSYSSKKPYKAILQYISHYTKPDDLVTDPFCGSGGTALAALLEGRKAIAIDLSPAATFITKNYCTPVDTDALEQAFIELESTVKDEMDWLYETRCDRCDGKAEIKSVVWSSVFKCPRCLNSIIFYDCVEESFSIENKSKQKLVNLCPICYENGNKEEIGMGKSQKINEIPVLVNYECLDGCNSKRDSRYYKDNNVKKREFFQKYDLEKLKEINEKEIPYQYPQNRMMNVESDTDPWGDKWRAGTSNFRTIAELFTKRNLWALSLYKKNIQNHLLLFCFSGAILNASKMYRHRKKGGGPQEGTYYLPPIYKELSLRTLFTQKYNNLIRAIPEINTIASTHLCISTESATNLNNITNNSIDYIFTDPPYGDARQYGELNFVWEVWLDFRTDWHQDEIIINKTRKKTELDWELLLRKVFIECFRILKPGRWISVCYHDASEGTWQIIQDLMSEIGFIPENIESTLYIETGQKSFNQLMSEKVTKRDLVINFRKPRHGETQEDLLLTSGDDRLSFQEKAKKIIKESLDRNPGSYVDKLYDELVSRMVRKGEFERHDFISLLRSVAEEVQIPDEQGKLINRWYLRDPEDTVEDAERRKEDVSANRLETFMVNYLNDHHEFEGVHYSDLFEHYLPVKEKPRRLLIDWLPEYFYRTSEGTWRPPQDDEERQQKSALRSSGSLRRIRRFTNAILNSVPPAEKDRPENAATLADWIYQCRRAGLFEQGKLLYERGGLSFDNLSDLDQQNINEDYEICLKRREPEKENKKTQPKLL
jgi:DNA modification methylase